MTTNPSVPTYGLNKCVVSANANIPISGTVTVSGAVTSSAYMDRVYKNDGTELTVKFKADSKNTAANHEIVAAVANKRIVILQLICWMKGGAETVTFNSNASAIAGAMDIADDEKVIFPYCPHGLFRTEVGEAFKIDLNVGGNNFRYYLTYVEY